MGEPAEADGTALLLVGRADALEPEPGTELECTLPRGNGTGAVRVGTGGLKTGLSVPVFAAAAGSDVVLPDKPRDCAAAIEATFGRTGTGGGMFRLTGTGGASLAVVPGVPGAVGSARDEEAGLSINPVPYAHIIIYSVSQKSFPPPRVSDIFPIWLGI